METAATFNGQTYAVPYAIESLALVRNLELAPDEPATLEDAVEEGQALVADGTASEALLLQVGQQGDAYPAYAFLSAFGGGFFDKNAEGDLDPDTVIVDDPRTVQGAELLEWLGSEGVVNVNMEGGNIVPLFNNGDVPYIITGPWAVPQMREAGIDYAIQPLPATRDGGQMRSLSGVQQFYISSKAVNTAIAEEFLLTVIASQEVQEELFQTSQRVPALDSAMEALSVDNAELLIWSAAAENSDPMPNIPQMNSVWAPVGQATADIISGKLTAQEGMDLAQKNIEQALGLN